MFTSISPLGEAAGTKLKHDLSMPAGVVGHSTHMAGGVAIKRDFEDAYTFKPSVKKGYHQFAEAYIDTFLTPDMREFRVSSGIKQEYQYVGPDDLLLPKGCYSWWGIDVSKWLVNADQETKAVVDDADPPPPYCSPPASIFGTVGFSTSLEYLLRSYQISRHKKMTDPKPDIYFLVGGTLRYPQEVGCVIIVCTEGDLRSEALNKYRPLQHPVLDNGVDPVFLPNGLLDANGKVVDFSRANKTEFRPRFMSEYTTWGFLMYALYYENEEDRLKCSRDSVAMFNTHGHSDKVCLMKEKITTEAGEKWVCPDNL